MRTSNFPSYYSDQSGWKVPCECTNAAGAAEGGPRALASALVLAVRLLLARAGGAPMGRRELAHRFSVASGSLPQPHPTVLSECLPSSGLCRCDDRWRVYVRWGGRTLAVASVSQVGNGPAPVLIASQRRREMEMRR